MDHAGDRGKGRLRVAFALTLLLSGAALVAQPTIAAATEHGLSFGEVTWVVDEDANTTSWTVEAVVTGTAEPDTPCLSTGWCMLMLFGGREKADGTIGNVTFLGSVGTSTGKLVVPASGEFTHTFKGGFSTAIDLTHLKLDLFGPGPWWTTGFQPIATAFEAVVVEGVTDDLLPHLEPFLDGLDWDRVDDTVELAEEMSVVVDLAADVCAAAEDALERPGRSKGKRLGTISEADMALATLCAILSDVADTPVPASVGEALALTLPPRAQGGSNRR